MRLLKTTSKNHDIR